ncbi:YdcF family protein [Luteolibacter flavescens]|uniref:YdcF family protein n=1 Tax=Luteolibacter flavescens TaxID=1859460 RepID=A0ABT3FUR5_9BACT|nr:YdcF family protein [Luteolibacter flavescens]MCW1887322.1 YdcF family protein [Luteolibacter flavescens]
MNRFTFILVRRKWIAGVLASLVAMVLCWAMWGNWPDPERQPVPWSPDLIVILGGGDRARVREGLLLARQYDRAPVIVTGDGSTIIREMQALGFPPERLIHEASATSTLENAQYCKNLIATRQHATVLLITNWFHAPRALAVFKQTLPECAWAVSFESKPAPPTKWDLASQRRERFAAIYYLLRHGIWSW